MMEESDQMLDFDAVWSEALYLQSECSDHDCPPPLFDLPPPPPPPWSSSSESEECSEEFDQCENIVIIDSGVNLEQTFQNLIIIAVSSAILVILIVFIVACIWRLVNILFQPQRSFKECLDHCVSALLSQTFCITFN